MAEYITAQEAMSFLDIAAEEDPDDLQDAIDAATDACIHFLGWDIASQEVTERHSGRNDKRLTVNRYPVTAIGAVSIDEAAVDVTDFFFRDNEIIRKSTVFPLGDYNVEITYTAGQATIPSSVKRAVLYTLKAMWDARGVDLNATGESYAGVLSNTFHADGAGSIPPAARSLLMTHKAVYQT